jgi:hypothetical protein
MTHSTDDLARMVGRASQAQRKEVTALLAPFAERGPSPPVPPAMRDFAERYAAAWCSQDPARVARRFLPRTGR